jgi:hypothetical protein
VAQVRVIFKIPDHFAMALFNEGIEIPGHLAYVEWFSLPRAKEHNSGMYSMTRSFKGPQNGMHDAAVVAVESIRCSCQLIPKFDKPCNRAWSAENVLDRCKHFFVNNFVDNYMYQTIW